jgi:cellulose synthase operon protein YhjQ
MPLICFASPKGGVGKTTLAANVAAEFAHAGKRVIALDLDPQNALRLHFGARLSDPMGYTHHLRLHPSWRQDLWQTPAGVALLPHGQIDRDGALELAMALAQDPTLLVAPLTEILADPDVTVIVDTMPGLSVQLATILPLVDLLIIVLLADAASVSLIPQIESGAIYGAEISGSARLAAPAGRMGYVLNQFDSRSRLGSKVADAAARYLGSRLLGIIYRDESAAEAMAAQKLIVNHAPASKAASDIAVLARTIEQRLVLLETERSPQRSRSA